MWRFLVCLLALLIATPAAAGEPAPKKTDKAKDGKGHTGAVVVAVGEAAHVHAKALARKVYADSILRPSMSEATAQVLSGGAAPEGDAELAKHAKVVRALGDSKDDEVTRRLAGSLARDLGARLVVLVVVANDEPSARVVRMPEEQLLAVKLTPKKETSGDPPTMTWTWTDTVPVLRELSIGTPPPPPRPTGPLPKPTPKPAPDDEDDGSLLTSPWFWGGLGLVVTVGLTVLILSQTALNEPDTVIIDGRIGP